MKPRLKLCLIIRITIVWLILTSNVTYCQENKEQIKPFKAISHGISAGLYFSGFNSIEESFPHYQSLEATFENKMTPGLHLSYSRNLFITKVYTWQPQISLIRIKHALDNHEWSRNGSTGTVKDAKYDIILTRLRFDLLQCLTFGDNPSFTFFAGPYLEFPLSSRPKGQIEISSYNELTHEQTGFQILKNNEIERKMNGGFGGLLGLGIIIPSEKNYLNLVVRSGKSFYNLTEQPTVKERFVTLSIEYIFSLYQNP